MSSRRRSFKKKGNGRIRGDQLSPKNPYGLPSNPKDLVAQAKLDFSVIPDAFLIELALAFYEGALKYGRYNWRMRPVKASVYTSAFRRHILKWESGEEYDKKTGTHHFGYAACCIAILFDAAMYGTLVDDRPPRGRVNLDVSAWLDNQVIERIKHLQQLFEGERPKQYTISDDIKSIANGVRRQRAKPATNKTGPSL